MAYALFLDTKHDEIVTVNPLDYLAPIHRHKTMPFCPSNSIIAAMTKPITTTRIIIVTMTITNFELVIDRIIGNIAKSVEGDIDRNGERLRKSYRI